jgi:predicted nuclease with TOPRIM domain
LNVYLTLQAHEAAQDRRLSELQATVDDVSARQEALLQANDALSCENDRLAGALAPLRGEHEALLAKYHRLKLGRAEAAEGARLLKAEKHVLAQELERCRRAVRESRGRLALTNEELFGLRATLGAVQAEAGDLRRRVEELRVGRGWVGENEEEEEEEEWAAAGSPSPPRRRHA